MRRYSVFDTDRHYFDDYKNAEMLRKSPNDAISPPIRCCWTPIRQHEGQFRLAFSLTGTALEQFQCIRPEVIDSFRELADTGCVEFLAETYYHSLAFFYSREEFRAQVEPHRKPSRSSSTRSRGSFATPNSSTTMTWPISSATWATTASLPKARIMSSATAAPISSTARRMRRIKLLLKNYRLSDDIAFRFSNRTWEQWPLTAEKFAQWVNQINGNGLHLQSVHGLRNLRRAPVGRNRHLRFFPPSAREDPRNTSDNNFLTPSQVSTATTSWANSMCRT